MLHELLLALSGYPGDIFVLKDDGEVEVVRELPFIHPTENAVLKRLCRLATHYNSFIRFLGKHGHCPGESIPGQPCGLYLKALCLGLDQVLDPYRRSLLALEKELLAEPHLSVAHVQTVLEEYQLLFPALATILNQIAEQNIHGCNILESLHKAAVCGIPQVKDALLRILHMCHSVLYKHLATWMLHGLLLDNYREFFIQRVQRSTPAFQAEQGAELEGEDDLGIGGLTGRQLQQILTVSEEGERTPTFERYTVDSTLLPSYIPTRVAEKILFIGESVQMFECDKQGAKHKYKGSIMRGQEEVFVRDLHRLAQPLEFDLMDFEGVIDKIRVYVAEQLWQLVVQEADLPGQLRTMKDFFLLGRGELFLAFIDQAQHLLRSPPSATTDHDVNMALQHAARNVLFEDEVLLQRFRLTTETVSMAAEGDKGQPSHPGVASKQSRDDDSSSQSGGVVESGWNSLSMTFKVEWPLHVLLTPSTLERYNTLFKFLLYVKRVQLELQHCWALQMQRKSLAAQDNKPWWLRNHMAFLIDNLQYYLQVDVIESQYSILLDKVQNTRDFEAIRLAHDQFLTSLLSQSFLLMKPISHCLNELLDLSHHFFILVSGPDVTLTSSELVRVEEITKNFQRQSGLLFKILSSVRNHQLSPHLAQLLLRIDFNKYFTLAGGQLGSFLPVSVCESGASTSSTRMASTR